MGNLHKIVIKYCHTEAHGKLFFEITKKTFAISK